MKEKFSFSYYSKFSILCAIGYLVPIYFFLKNEQITEVWLLYIGNTLFAGILIVSGIIVNQKFKDHSNLADLIIPGIRVIVSAILIICFFLIILALMFGINVAKQMTSNPADLYLMLAMNAIIVNFLIGCFSVFLGGVAILTYKQNARGEDIT